MIAPLLALGTMVGFRPDVAQIQNQPLPKLESRADVVEASDANSQNAELVVRCQNERGPIAFFASVTDSTGQTLDPTGRGLYRGGRFAADAMFMATVKPGKTRISIQAGPNYLPFETEADLKAGRRTELKVVLAKWFSPEERGWYGGDNHVHAAHDPTGEVRSDVPYTAILARANGLSFITQASSDFPFEDHDKQNRPNFFMKRSLENRQGSFSGHLNSPGIEMPPKEREETMNAAMPAVAAIEWVRQRGAAIIHTHTMVPAHQLHWMGATEAYSYPILGTTPDAMDLDGEASEHLWFTVLSLGNKVAASGSTDAALERSGSPMPGARRIYVRSDRFDYDAFVKGIRAGKTIATNAGPLFAFLEMDGKGVSETLRPGTHRLKVELQSLHPLEEAYLVRSGVVVKHFDVRGKSGATTIEDDVTDAEDAWYVVKAKDTKGSWAITSPIYVETPERKPKPFAGSIVLEIGNFTRLAEVRKQFMAHLIATVSPEDPLAKVELLRDSKLVKAFEPKDGNHIEDNKTPVTETFGEFKPGWLWVPEPGKAFRFQADWYVSETGWYEVRATTKSGRVILSDAIRYDAASPVSNATSLANLFGKDIKVRHWGYGESIALDKIDNGDYWWYPDNTYFRMETWFASTGWHVDSGNEARMKSSFRASGSLSQP